MTPTADDHDPLDDLAEEYLQRRRRGERPDVSEYVARFPGRAEEVREFLSALRLIEDLKPDADETSETAESPLRPGASAPERIGEYRVIREIGRGGMGVVYEAEQESLGRRVALKVLALRSVASPEQVGRFLREARAAAQLHHSNIVPVFGVGEHEGLHFYTMQFIRGTGLDQVLEEVRRQGAGSRIGRPRRDEAPTRAGRFEPSSDNVGTTASLVPAAEPLQAAQSASRQQPSDIGSVRPEGRLTSSADSAGRYARAVARLGRQVAEALEYAHRNGVLHRDIKPSNLLLDAQDNTWVTDFGLAKATQDDDLTRTGDLVGTIRYMAPERFRGRCDARSDVYALGLTLYELLALRPAFDASDRESLMYQVTQTEPPRLRSLEPSVPRDLETIVHKAIEREPRARYATAGEMARDLARFLEDRPIEARRVTSTERVARWVRRNPAPAALGAAVVVLLTAIAIGSTIAAVRLSRQHAAAVAAGREARERLWESYLAQARSHRRGDEAGRRASALQFVSEASRLGVQTDRRWVLRDEAIACLAIADLRRIDAGDPAALKAESIEPDLARHAALDANGDIVIQDLLGDGPPVVLPGPEFHPVSFRFSRDGRRLAARGDGVAGVALVVWDVERREVVLETEGVQGDAFDFSADGGRLAAVRRNGAIDVFQLPGGREKRLPPGSIGHDVAFDPAGGRLAVSSLSREKAVEIRDVKTGNVERTFALPTHAYGLAWHPEGRFVAAGGEDGRIFLLDVESPESEHRILERHQGAVLSIAFHPGGDLLASASWDGTLRLWDVPMMKSLVRAPLPETRRVRFSDDGRFLGPGHDGERHWLWEVHAPRECVTLVDRDSTIDSTWSIQFRTDRDLLVTAGGGGVRFDAPAEGKHLASLPLPGTAAATVVQDGSLLLTSGEAGLLGWPIRTASEDGLQVGPPSPVGLPAGLPTGRISLASDGHALGVVLDWERGRAAILDLKEPGRRVEIAGHPGLERLAFSPDVRWLATGTWKGTGVKVWDVATGRLEADLDVSGSAEALFSPDGKWLVTGSGREYRAWEVGTWEKGRGIDRVNTGGLPGKIAFSPDSRTLALVLSRTVVQLVDPTTFEVLTTLVPPDLRNVAHLDFSPDGARLALTHNSRELTLWNLRAVRTELASMDLDLAMPPIPEGTPVPAAPTSLSFEYPPWRDSLSEAETHAENGRWAEAADVYAAAFAAGNRSPHFWSRLALLHLALDRREEYQRTCREMLKHFEGEPPRTVANLVAWSAALAPDAVPAEDHELLLRMARLAASRGDHIGLNTLGSALYRAGRFDEALETLERSAAAEPSGGVPDDWAFLAMCCHRLGRQQEAIRWLERMAEHTEAAERAGNVLSPWRRLELEILAAEAKSVVEGSP